MRHETDGAEDADTREDFERGVRKTGDQSGARQVRLGLEVRGVGQHDAKAHGQRVEDLRKCGQPHLGISKRAPVRREESIEAFNGTRQEERSNDEREEEDDEERQEDLVRRLDALGQATANDEEHENPHESKRDHDGPCRGPREGVAGNNLQEGVREEGRRVGAPGLVHGVDRVLHAPREDRTVVDHDDEADEGLEPADELASADDLAQRPRR